MQSYKHLFAPSCYNKIESTIIKVNQAGELGAVKIYLGQLKALKQDDEILEMLEGELEHLEFFESQIKEVGVAPSLFNELWKPLAFLMGYLSAKHSRGMAMLCTQKVEEVIERHYKNQQQTLELFSSQKAQNLKEKIIKFRNEELEHMHKGKNYAPQNFKFAFIFTFITKLGVFVSSKI